MLKAVLLAALLAGAAAVAQTRPMVIAHRGASGERPEHTLSAYLLAIEQGADAIEPDLVPTRDGVLVARHENEISETTDVAARPEFAARRTTKTIDGRAVTGWFTEDFTLAELKTLRAKERLPQLRPANAAFDGREAVPTFQEVVDLAKAEGARRGRTIAVYPELKHPAYFRSVGLATEPMLVAALKANGLDAKDAPVFVQSFEPTALQRLRPLTKARLVQLIAADGEAADGSGPYRAMTTPEGLRALTAWADGIGPEKTLVVPRGPDGRSLAATTLVTDAHAAGLLIHPWTFRAENYFLPAELRRGDPARPDAPRLPGDLAAELELFRKAGVDGVFTDHPGAAVQAFR